MNTKNSDSCLKLDNIRIFPIRRTVYADCVEVVLTRMEFDVLLYLATNPDIAFTKEQIYEAASRDAYSEASYMIKDVVYRLRNKLGCIASRLCTVMEISSIQVNALSENGRICRAKRQFIYFYKTFYRKL